MIRIQLGNPSVRKGKATSMFLSRVAAVCQEKTIDLYFDLIQFNQGIIRVALGELGVIVVADFAGEVDRFARGFGKVRCTLPLLQFGSPLLIRRFSSSVDSIYVHPSQRRLTYWTLIAE